ncbi:PaaI family thioesterase [Halopelagius fulvigenes]|uniref:PaaI family thioesterase n=1 Tax=Halopelagius fulvigenes TaxID=1198324 RepID=A0ABD5TYH5_9EURY
MTDGDENRDDDGSDGRGDVGFPSEAAAFVQQYIEQEHGYLSWLNTRVEEIERGRVVMTIPYDEKLTNTTNPPTVHGGIAATLIDTAGGIAQRTVFDDPMTHGVATVNLNVNYLRRASGTLRATAEVVRAGGTIGVSTVTVVSRIPDEAEDDVAEGTSASRQTESDDAADRWEGTPDSEAVATGQAAYRLFR